MRSYPINELERLTGIKAHTIRIWEKRYGIIAPDRTSTNRRSYDDDHVRKLLNVTTLLAKGQKISKIAALSEAELHKEIVAITQAAPHHSTASAGYINNLVKAMLAFDEHAFDEVFTNAVSAYGMYEAMVQIVYPFLHKTGMLWSINKTAPVQEHFATNLLRRQLMKATGDLLPAKPSAKSFLLFLPPGEFHEIALLFANYMIRAKGHKTIYLGQDVPFENIKEITPIIKPTYLLFFYIAPRPQEEVAKQIKAYAGINNKVQVLVAGNTDLLPTKQSKTRKITYLTGVASLANIL